MPGKLLEAQVEGLLETSRLNLAVVPLYEVANGVGHLLVGPGQLALAVLFEILLDQFKTVLFVLEELPALEHDLLHLLPPHLVVLR